MRKEKNKRKKKPKDSVDIYGEKRKKKNERK